MPPITLSPAHLKKCQVLVKQLLYLSVRKVKQKAMQNSPEIARFLTNESAEKMHFFAHLCKFSGVAHIAET